jgi:hypothetical protein
VPNAARDGQAVGGHEPDGPGLSVKDRREVIRCSDEYYNVGKEAVVDRKKKNQENWLAYRAEQDWGDKLEDQSRETLPDFPIAVDQQVATLSRATTDTDDWFTVDSMPFGQSLLTEEDVAEILRFYLERLYIPGDYPDTFYDIHQWIGDSYKLGILESIVTCKVRPVMRTVRVPRLMMTKGRKTRGERADENMMDYYKETVEFDDREEFRLSLDLIGFEDFLRDPTLGNNWVCHESDRYLWELKQVPTYNQEVLDGLQQWVSEEAEAYRRRRDGRRDTKRPRFRVRVREFWGNMHDLEDGSLKFKNCKWVQCNKFLLQDPINSPLWHGRRPIISSPLNGIPLGTIHNAIADHAVPMWRFMNELISLMFDGAIRSAWGVYQVRSDQLERPEEIEAGVPQAYTAQLKANAPMGYKFMERMDEGEVPGYAVQMLARAEQAFQIAMATPDLKMGALPQKEVRAVEIVEAMQASGSLFEAFAARYEQYLEAIFELAWATILQYQNHWTTPEMIGLIGPEKALEMQRMGPARRFIMLRDCNFRVRGLRAVASKNRLFNKLAGFAQMMAADPNLMQAFSANYSYKRLMEQMLRNAGVVVRTLQKTQDEIDAEAADAQAAAQDQQQQEQLAQQQSEATQAQAQGGSQQALAGAPTPPSVPTTGVEQAQASAEMGPKTPAGQTPGTGIAGV